jgi:RimJ/RimL family protein N-acetyltransferase
MIQSSAIPRVETARLILRGPIDADLPAMMAFLPSDRMAYIGGPVPAEEARVIFDKAREDWAARGYNRWNIELRETGEVIGRCGVSHPFGYPEPELGWVLFEGFEGQGYAREAAIAALNYVQSMMGLTGIVSLIHPENIRSKHLATRIGGRFAEMGEIVGITVEIWRYPDAAT